MNHAAAGAALIWLTAGVLCAQGQPLKPRDLYLERVPASSTKGAPHHLGVRYTMLMVDPESRRVQSADPDQAFREGNCLAVEVAPNRDGDLYVFNHGSSGDWQLLMPSPLMPGEPTSVKAGQLVRLPADHCFILDNQPGVETLVLVVTELKEDVQSIRALLGAQGDGSNATSPPVLTPVTTAANLSSVRAKIEAWQQLASRDMGIQKLAQPQSAGERPFSVYAVNSSAAEAGRLVIEIKIRHE